jgi:hypothetical protein
MIEIVAVGLWGLWSVLLIYAALTRSRALARRLIMLGLAVVVIFGFGTKLTDDRWLTDLQFLAAAISALLFAVLAAEEVFDAHQRSHH